MDWTEFKQSQGWKEIAATIRERQRMILEDLVNPAKCSGKKVLAGLQAEFSTCEWLLQLPDIPAQEEGKDEEVG